MASFEGQQENYSNEPAVENIPKRPESREGSAERKVSKDREEKLKYARDRQNEERQRKIEELRAQAEAAQKYREQKEEERRRRIEEMRVRDTEKRHQVEERKKAIIEAEKERREYILKKNQDRESRIETKKRDRNSIAFAFGSSTPRLLDVPADYGLVSPSTFWSQRRSTSISNVAGASLSRRSSERELADSGAKKRTSSSTDRHDEDIVDTSQNIMFRSVYRRKTDLMPTIPSPRDGHYGSRSSLSTTPRTPGRAYSMNRLDQLAQPIRRNGEHVRSVLERERRERELEMLDETASLGGGISGRRIQSGAAAARGRRGGSASGGASGTSTAVGAMSRSMTHLAAGGGQRERGSRSGNVTPGGHGHLSGSRPGSAMSTSTTLSTSGLVPRRPATATRKPRPASIAGTGMSLEEINKLKREQKPPVKTTNAAASPSTSTAQTTPKRTPNLMSTSMIVTSSSSRISSAEKKTPSKREPLLPKASSASKAQTSRTASSERISRHGLAKESISKCPPSMSTSMIVTSTTTVATTAANAAPVAEPKANGVAKEQPEQLNTEVPTAAVVSVSKAEKEALNTEKTEQVQVQQQEQKQELLQMDVETQPETVEVAPTVANYSVEEKADEGNEKLPQVAQETAASGQKKTSAPTSRNGSKENSEVRELTPPTMANLVVDGGSNDLMTASMIAKKITTEEEAKAALAERRRLAREEAERQAELERQRLEAERLAEIKAQEEEAERQRLFEEESTRLAEEQRRGEEERLRKAIEEAQQQQEEEQRRREDEERQRVEREEAEKKAKEEAEKQRIEVAERLKREEKEREERRKRVEAIMSRTRKAGAAATPVKESNDGKIASAAKESDSNSSNSNSNSNSTGGSPNSSNSSSTDVAATAVASVTGVATTVVTTTTVSDQAIYEQSVLDKENSLINSFSNMIIDENAKNLHQFEVSNGKLLHVEAVAVGPVAPTVALANGNGHIENVNNKNDINLLQDAVTPVPVAVPATVTQLIDLSIESQHQDDLHINNNNNNNNNNSLLTSTAATTTLVTADSHENKDISLL
ncbi:serine-rich adhesin for platelets isoform X4 [Drosophila innubila]|uniref:serine-rich adhesin for platelets isoform X4 n=1 Tax=Drosophila innubila TaxID=198719 RepID=UPI00148C0C63|nr:serine-rich adhesin for platelets isoform X4 [Drosophila innubila]